MGVAPQYNVATPGVSNLTPNTLLPSKPEPSFGAGGGGGGGGGGVEGSVGGVGGGSGGSGGAGGVGMSRMNQFGPVALPRFLRGVLILLRMSTHSLEMLDMLSGLVTFAGAHSDVVPLLLSLGDGGSITMGLAFHVAERTMAAALEVRLEDEDMSVYRVASEIVSRTCTLVFELVLAASVTAPYFKDPENVVVGSLVSQIGAKMVHIEPFELQDESFMLALLSPLWLLTRVSRFVVVFLEANHGDDVSGLLRLLRAGGRKRKGLAALPTRVLLRVVGNIAKTPDGKMVLNETRSPSAVEVLVGVPRAHTSDDVMALQVASTIRALGVDTESLSWLRERLTTIDGGTGVGRITAEEVRAILRESALASSTDVARRRSAIKDGLWRRPAGLRSEITSRILAEEGGEGGVGASVPKTANLVARVDDAFVQAQNATRKGRRRKR